FRLTGSRDYTLPPEQCVALEPDGVTVSVDVGKSDLLLETELPRFAELVDRGTSTGRRQYRFTPASLASARAGGLRPPTLEWGLQQRVGQNVSPAVRLLLSAGQPQPPRLVRHLVLEVASADLADGLMQWPLTRGLIADRLGPTALVIEEANVPALRERLTAAGIELDDGASAGS